MGPSDHFYSFMGLMTLDIGFPRVDRWSTGLPGSGRHINPHISLLNRSRTN